MHPAGVVSLLGSRPDFALDAAGRLKQASVDRGGRGLAHASHARRSFRHKIRRAVEARVRKHVVEFLLLADIVRVEWRDLEGGDLLRGHIVVHIAVGVNGEMGQEEVVKLSRSWGEVFQRLWKRAIGCGWRCRCFRRG